MSTLALGRACAIIRKRPWSVPLLLFLLAFIARMVAWPHSDVVNADAVTRALIGESYMLYPGWVGDGVWPPLHFYLNGLFTVLCGSRVTGSVLVNILLGSAIVFPVFALVRRWSSSTVAAAVALIVVFEPLVFRNSLQPLSEIPFFFFSACAFNSASIALSSTSSKGARHAVLAGLFITVASGMRYEAWALIVLIAVQFVVARRWQSLLLFMVPALVFPIAWMITDHLAQGNIFQGLEQVIHWQGNAVATDVLDNELRLRTVFFPASFLLALSPLVVLLGVAGAVKTIVKNELKALGWPWLLWFPLFMVVMISKARHAELLLQHRFTMTLVLLFIPYLMLGFKSLRSKALILLLAVFFSGWGLYSSMNMTGPSWLRYSTKLPWTGNALAYIQQNTLGELKAIPALEHRTPDTLVKAIDSIHMDRKLLVLDFLGWQDTYNVAFRADIRATSVVFLPTPDAPFEQGEEHLENYLGRLNGPHGVLVLNRESAYFAHIEQRAQAGPTLALPNKILVLTPAGDVGNAAVYTFETRQVGQ